MSRVDNTFDEQAKSPSFSLRNPAPLDSNKLVDATTSLKKVTLADGTSLYDGKASIRRKYMKIFELVIFKIHLELYISLLRDFDSSHVLSSCPQPKMGFRCVTIFSEALAKRFLSLIRISDSFCFCFFWVFLHFRGWQHQYSSLNLH